MFNDFKFEFRLFSFIGRCYVFSLNMIIGGSSFTSLAKASIVLTTTAIYCIATAFFNPFADRSRAIVVNLSNIGKVVQAILVVVMVQSSSNSVETGFVVITIIVLLNYLSFFLWKFYKKIKDFVLGCCCKQQTYSRFRIISTALPSNGTVGSNADSAQMKIGVGESAVVEVPRFQENNLVVNHEAMSISTLPQASSIAV
jgi:heme/copper-type cytochrome/quinol oxidase subunit 4